LLLNTAKGRQGGHGLRASPIGRAGNRPAGGWHQQRKSRRRSARQSSGKASCRLKLASPSRCGARLRRRWQARPLTVGASLPEAWHRKCSEQLAARAAVLRGSAAALPHATGQEYLTYCLATSRYTPSFASRLRGSAEPSNRVNSGILLSPLTTISE
jgi:hypothetical protein